MTAASSAPGTSPYGQPLTFTAWVAGPYGGTPTGSVDFYDYNSTTQQGHDLGSAAVQADGEASISTSSLAIADHQITATYSGDGNFAGGSASLDQQVTAASCTTITSGSSESVDRITTEDLFPVIVYAEATPDPSTDGTFSVLVSVVGSGDAPSGTVDLFDASTQTDLGSGELLGGYVPIPVSGASVGDHEINVSYSGDSTHESGSTTVDEEVENGPSPPPTQGGDSTTSASSSPNPSDFGSLVKFSATVSPVGGSGATPTGDVDFLDTTTGTDLGDPTLVGGSASFSSSDLALGDNQITVTYSGDSNYNVSSTTLDQTVNKTATNTVVTTSPSPSNYGDSVTFTATVSAAGGGGGTPTGSVDFDEDDTTSGQEQDLGSFNLYGDSVVFTTSDLNAGSHQITATYSGDADYAGSSGTTHQQVNKLQTTTTLSASPPSPSAFGQMVQFTATVSAGSSSMATPTGTVQFYDGSTSLGNPPVDANGNAILSTSQLAVGDHKITAIYGSDNNHYSSASAPVNQQVTAAPPTGTLTLLDDNGNAVSPTGGNQYASGVVFITPTGGSQATVNMQVTIPAGCKDVVDLDFTPDLAVSSNGGPVTSGTVVTTGETLFVKGTSASGAVNGDNITLVDATTTTTLAQVNFTAVSVSMKSITFTSDYQSDYSTATTGGTQVDYGMVNGVYAATNPADTGVCVASGDAGGLAWASDGTLLGSADWSSETGQSYAIAQKMGSQLTATLLVSVQPEGFQYTINSTSYEADEGPTFGSYMDFSSNAVTTASESGGDDAVAATAAGVLPNMIADLNQQVLWSISASSASFSSSVDDTRHEILVTYDNPAPATGDRVTDKRLEAAISACAGLGEGPNPNEVAQAIQNWLPGNAVWQIGNGTYPSPSNASDFWGLIQPTNTPLASLCNQHAMLHMLMLEELGIPATAEAVLPTQTALTTSVMNFIPMSLANPNPNPNLLPKEGNAQLTFDFSGQANNWEGGVLVDNNFFPEGSSTQSSCYGVVGTGTGTTGTAEYKAMVQIANNMCGNPNIFQHWWNFITGQFVTGAGASVPLVSTQNGQNSQSPDTEVSNASEAGAEVPAVVAGYAAVGPGPASYVRSPPALGAGVGGESFDAAAAFGYDWYVSGQRAAWRRRAVDEVVGSWED